MPPSKEALEHWTKILGALPKETPTEKFEKQLIKAGIGPIPGNPLSDPLFLPAEKSEERKRVRQAYELWEEWPGTLWDPSDANVQLNSGEWIHPHELRLRMDRKAFDLLRRRADVRTVAAECHLTLEEVEAVKERCGIE